ncbi:ARSENITE INDUCUBLE RNA ASSOCIATED PROTEIN AIP-1-RELATED [Salix viminalis]|uniref:ARSENITE INDUCUBLE RNA ASSOCIATED PROTEIN AIP-1-RELATED n=1 Tax=Salix viminalis TaxID=40686 RepID=A0A9Q0V4S9_SALVM|nr:ARSENITE INDUCUBLE RNA ASSOCIATED PROTEIN AIP-1-RELATED [Salix viminalis]
MGTPQFPDLGKHCSVEDCKLIDFLPFTCDRCRQVFCLEHRSYIQHDCPKADSNGVTVVICPLCAKGVRLVPDEDPNISWEVHVNTECDPSNYDKVTKKRKCPVRGCREVLTFSNTIKCRDCTLDHCLKHRFGQDHNCPGPKKPDVSYSFMGLLNRSKKEESKPNRAATVSSSKWATNFLSAASTVRASAEAGMTKLSNEISQAWQTATSSASPSSSNGSGGIGPEECPQCGTRFSSVTNLVEHVQKVHEKGGNQSRVLQLPMEVCPKCSKGFRDPVALVEHVERDHRGTSKA